MVSHVGSKVLPEQEARHGDASTIESTWVWIHRVVSIDEYTPSPRPARRRRAIVRGQGEGCLSGSPRASVPEGGLVSKHRS
jgi:hypothetical protein